jgi:hypothetical protein
MSIYHFRWLDLGFEWAFRLYSLELIVRRATSTNTEVTGLLESIQAVDSSLCPAAANIVVLRMFGWIVQPPE